MCVSCAPFSPFSPAIHQPIHVYTIAGRWTGIPVFDAAISTFTIRCRIERKRVCTDIAERARVIRTAVACPVSFAAKCPDTANTTVVPCSMCRFVEEGRCMCVGERARVCVHACACRRAQGLVSSTLSTLFLTGGRKAVRPPPPPPPPPPTGAVSAHHTGG